MRADAFDRHELRMNRAGLSDLDRAVVRLTPGDKFEATNLQIIRPVSELITRFPSTRYYGSKRKLLNWMAGHVGVLGFDTVLDAFGGTGSVSLLLKAMRKSVTYHDGFRFNEDVARTILASEPALSRGEVESIFNAVEPRHGVISEHFSGIFFTDAENSWLDGFVNQISRAHNLPQADALLRHLIYQSCLKKRPFNLFHRPNLAIRTNTNVTRSFGNAVTWERSFTQHALQAYDELVRMPHLLGPPAQILMGGDAATIKPGYDLVYIDPPYINRDDRYNRDDYWRRYHFLEGIARYDEWNSLIDESSSVRLFTAPPWFKQWGRAATFRDCLFDFIHVHRNSIVVMSYVSGTAPSEIEIMTHFQDIFCRVSLHSIAHRHALSKTPKRELLFIGLPR